MADYRAHKAGHNPTSQFVLISSSLKRVCETYRMIFAEEVNTVEAVFETCKEELKTRIRAELLKKTSIKAGLVLLSKFCKPGYEDGIGVEGDGVLTIPFRASQVRLSVADDLDEFISEGFRKISTVLDDFSNCGSGWNLLHCMALSVEVTKCRPLSGSCGELTIYRTRLRSEVIAISAAPEHSDWCFFFAVARHFTHSDDPKVILKFIHEKLNLAVPAPVKISDVSVFERKNPQLNCRINVLYEEDKEIYPLVVSKNENIYTSINLLLVKSREAAGDSISSDSEVAVVNHYALIEDLDKFLRKPYRHPVTGATTSYEKCSFCVNCLNKFSSKKVLNEHKEFCLRENPQKIVYPEPGSVFTFKNHYKKFQAMHIGAFDFESLQIRPDRKCQKCGPADDLKACPHKTTVETEQIPFCYTLTIINRHGKAVHMSTYTGLDAAEHFIDELLRIEPMIHDLTTVNIPMMITDEEQQMFYSQTHCHICEDLLGIDRVRDHDHLTGIITHARILTNKKM